MSEPWVCSECKSEYSEQPLCCCVCDRMASGIYGENARRLLVVDARRCMVNGCFREGTRRYQDYNAPGGTLRLCEGCDAALGLLHADQQGQQGLLQSQQSQALGIQRDAELRDENTRLRARVAELEEQITAPDARVAAGLDAIKRLTTLYNGLRNEGQQRITAMQDALGTMRSENTELLAENARLRRELRGKR